MRKPTRPTTMLVLAAALVTACAGGDAGPSDEPANGDAGEAGATADPACEDIRAFADQLTDVAFTLDYEPSSGPVELAEWADVVLSGHLTGEVTAQGEYIGYELAEVAVLAGAADELDGGTATVAVAYTPTYEPAETYAEAIPPGARVIAFADVAESVPGGLIAWLPEGFMTGCEGEPPVGWVESYDAWGEMGSLDDVEAAVAGAEPAG